ncbi:MAG: MFS transporter [Pseudomonadota bacterium]
MDKAVRRRIWGFWAFDWASQPYFTVLLTFVFGPYFALVLSDSYMAEGLDEEAADAAATSVWSFTLTIVGLIIAVTAPVLGAFADTTGRRLPWIALFSVFYVAGAFGLWWLLPDASNVVLALCLFGIGMIGAEFATVFTNSLLPDLAPPDELGAISGTGFALGYAGGVLALAIALCLFVAQDNGLTLIGIAPVLGLDPALKEGTRAIGPLVAFWYVVFMIPFFVWMREPKGTASQGTVGQALSNLKASLKRLPQRVSMFAYLGSSMFYRDALNALYGFGGTYATLVLNWSVPEVGAFGVIAALSSAFATWIGGKIDRRLGPKPVIIAMIWILIGVCTFVLGMTREMIWGIPLPAGSSLPDTAFFVCGAIIGSAGGVLQSASRTMMCRHADEGRATEAFGLYALAGKATTFLGTLLIGVVTAIFGSTRYGMAPLIVLFLIGLVLLTWVRAEGEPDFSAAEPAE